MKTICKESCKLHKGKQVIVHEIRLVTPINSELKKVFDNNPHLINSILEDFNKYIIENIVDTFESDVIEVNSLKVNNFSNKK